MLPITDDDACPVIDKVGTGFMCGSGPLESTSGEAPDIVELN